MKRFDFSQNGGMLFTQDRLDWMQAGYIEAMKALGSVAGNSRCVLNGVQLLSGDWNSGVLSDGWIYDPVEGVVPFVGGVVSATNRRILFETLTDVVPFEVGGNKPVKLIRRAVIGAGGGPELINLVKNPFGTALGRHHRSDWVAQPLAGGSGVIMAMLDRIAGRVYVKGTITRQANNVTGNVLFSLLQVGSVQSSSLFPVTPPEVIHFQTSFENPVQNASGVQMLVGNGRLDNVGQIFAPVGNGVAVTSYRLYLNNVYPMYNNGMGSHVWTQHFNFNYKTND